MIQITGFDERTKKTKQNKKALVCIYPSTHGFIFPSSRPSIATWIPCVAKNGQQRRKKDEGRRRDQS